MTRFVLSAASLCLSQKQLGLLLMVIGLAIAPIHRSDAVDGPGAELQPVSAGGWHNCRIRSDGTPACWGDNEWGQASPPAGTFSTVSAGWAHSCGVRSDATLACWGQQEGGKASPPAGAFGAVSAGANHSCGIRSDGTLACWGEIAASPPTGEFTAISAGQAHSCAVRSDSTLACWGRNLYGESDAPAGVFIAVSAGQFHSCGVRGDGTLACWGRNGYNANVSPPTGVFIAVSAGFEFSCGVRSDGTLTCWGDPSNALRQMNAPAGTFSAVSSGQGHSCGVRSDATLACWGNDYNGQAPQLSLLPSALPNATTVEAFNQVFGLRDVGYRASLAFPYMPPSPGFALVSGALPPGLTLTAGGLLSGKPTIGGSFNFTVEGEDANGFTAEGSYSVFVEGPTDSSPPIIVATVSGTLGDNGWYLGDIAISWSVTDAESTITSTIGCAIATLTSDSAGTTYSCNATSAGGTESQSVSVKRDATAPVLAPEVTPSAILLNGTGSIAANASDALSGLASQSCAALDTSTVGNRTSACTATDLAGNTASATAAYSVPYGFGGFTPPVDNPPAVNFANAGRTVPFKWHLVDAAGLPVSNLSGVTLRAYSMSCDGNVVVDEVEQYVSGGTSFHNNGSGQYQYNWQSPPSYQKTCKRIVLDMGDGSAHEALFRFH